MLTLSTCTTWQCSVTSPALRLELLWAKDWHSIASIDESRRSIERQMIPNREWLQQECKCTDGRLSLVSPQHQRETRGLTSLE